MFGAKKKKNEIASGSELIDLASRLGAERRQSVRVRCPSEISLSILPTIQYRSEPISAIDISLGGCCLLDPKEALGSNVGNEIELVLTWGTTQEPVTARIVGRVDHKRHIQFLNLPPARREFLRSAITPGVRGLSLRPNASLGSQGGPTLDVAEMWSSMSGDSVIVENDVHRQAEVHIMGAHYELFREAKPLRYPNQPVTAREIEDMILFLVNIPQASPLLVQLTDKLQSALRESA